MKKIKFTCPNCQAKLRVPTHLAGITAPCPKCGRKITAPTDLDCIVEEEPAARAGTPAARRNASQLPVSAASVSASVAEAPAHSDHAGVRSSHVPVAAFSPAVVSAGGPVSSPLPPPAPPPPSFSPQVSPAYPEVEEPIVKETFFIPPAPQPGAAPPVSVEQPQQLEETQPIQINPLPSTLPRVGQSPVQMGTALPRLDANRGSGAGSAGLEALLSSPAGGNAPTRLHLPRPDELNGQQSPGDFILPATAPTSVPPAPSDPGSDPGFYFPEGESGTEETYRALPDSLIPDIADLDMSAPGIPMDELGDLDPVPDFALLNIDLGEGKMEEPIPLESMAPIQSPITPSVSPITPPVSEVALREIGESFQQPVPEYGMERHASAEPFSGQSEEEEVYTGEEQFRNVELSSGSFTNLLSRQNEPESDQTGPMQPPGTPKPVPSREDLDDFFEPRKPVPASNASVTANPSQSLEEMFGELPEGGEKKKLSTVVMLSMIGAVAIIATVFVVILINAAGGLSPQISSNQTEVTQPPGISDVPAVKTPEPAGGEVPAMIDPVAQDRAGESSEGITRSTTTLPGDTSRPVLIADNAPPANIETPASTPHVVNTPVPVEDAPALSFDERVQQIVNGGGSPGSGMNIIAGDPEPGPLDSLDATIADFTGSAASAVEGLTGAVNDAASPLSSNYNPPSAFPAPGPGDAPLGKTHDLLDAFLRAPDWQSRIPYIFQGESLAPAMEDYYKKWPVTSFERFSLQLFQLEQDVSLGGPYWVYLVSTNDLDQGYPVIVRSENDTLKVDWEIYSEFQDQHFVEFQKGAIASPHTFRLVIERVSDYFGSDRDAFTDLQNYLVYQINPPYGDPSELSEYAFVKKDSPLARELDEVVGLNDEPLAVILTMKQKAFPHGVKHLEITDYVTEGWFR